MSTKSKLLYLLLVGILLTQACGIGQPPISEEVVSEELISFMLGLIIDEEINGTANYIHTSGMSQSPPEVNIIIYAPPIKNGEDSSEYLDYEHPIKVWWFTDNKLTEAEDKQKAIEEYNSLYVDETASDIFVWGFYYFGINKISSNHRSAEIYLKVSCGPFCGHEIMYKIRRDSNGEWSIYDGSVLSVPKLR